MSHQCEYNDATVTIEEQAALLEAAGVESVDSEDATKCYRKQSLAKYEQIRSDLYPTLEEKLGQEGADHFVENWRAMTVVIERGEMKQAYNRGRKPRQVICNRVRRPTPDYKWQLLRRLIRFIALSAFSRQGQLQYDVSRDS